MSTTPLEKADFIAASLAKAAAANAIEAAEIASASTVNAQLREQLAVVTPTPTPPPPEKPDPPFLEATFGVGKLTAKIGHDGERTTGYRLRWSGPQSGEASIAANALSHTVSPLASGMYTVTLTAVGPGGESATATATGEVKPVPTPTPTPVPGDAIADLAVLLRRENREPTAAEVKACEDWALAKGAYTIPADAKPVAAGSDLTKLAAGNYAAAPGDFPFPAGTVVAHVYAATRGTAKIAGKNGQQLDLKGGLYGFAGSGGGKSEKLNDNAAVEVGHNGRFVGGSWRNAQGVAIAGGNLSSGKVGRADDAKVIGNLIEDNGSAGVGGKWVRGEVAYNVFRRNNVKVKDGDGANIGKFTRTEVLDLHHNVATDGVFADFWADINNGELRLRSNLLARCKPISKDFQGVGIKLEINRPNHLIEGNIIFGQHGPAVVLNETREVEVTGNILRDGTGPAGASFHVRQLTRDDEDEKADIPGSWRLGNILFDHNLLLGGKGRFTRSGAGTKLTAQLLKQWNVVIGPNNVGTLSDIEDEEK